MPGKRNPIVDMLDVLAAEHAELTARGLHFRVVCRDGHPQEPLAAFFLYRGKVTSLELSPTLLALFVYMAAWRVGQSSAQIAEGIRRGQFAKKAPSRSSVKVWIDRLRRRMADKMVGTGLDSASVVVTARTESNVALYRLDAIVEFYAD
jgi:hypothetical protein